MAHAQAVIFGEVLFDCFPDSRSVLGGAPFNVAWHLQRLSCNPLFISSVGKDDHGDKVRSTMQAHGMNISGLQISTRHPTGQVTVKLENGQPSYDIVTEQAYDHISEEQALASLPEEPPALIYHGSLALRTVTSKAALDALLEKSQAPIFLDINLRDPWWEMPLLEILLHRATWVKLNDEELCIASKQVLSDGPELKNYAKELFENYQLERLIVTRGEQGAFVVSKEGITEGSPVTVKNLVDTVGAGDAFSAVTIAGILEDCPITDSLNKALAFAAEICQQQGATA